MAGPRAHWPSVLEMWRAFLWVGAVGALLDAGHTFTDVLGYNKPDIVYWRTAWWVPPQFGVGGIIMLILPHIVGFRPHRLCQESVLYVQIMSAVFVYAISSVLSLYKWTDAGISAFLAFSVIATWAITDTSAHSLGVCMLAGLLGWAYEGTLCHLGFFHYNNPDLWHVRHWICWIWVLIGPHCADWPLNSEKNPELSQP